MTSILSPDSLTNLTLSLLREDYEYTRDQNQSDDLHNEVVDYSYNQFYLLYLSYLTLITCCHYFEDVIDCSLKLTYLQDFWCQEKYS